jgi:hypothetical protein
VAQESKSSREIVQQIRCIDGFRAIASLHDLKRLLCGVEGFIEPSTGL